MLATPVLSGFRTAVVEPASWLELDVCPICSTAADLVDVASLMGEEPGAAFSACAACAHLFCRRRPTSAWFDAFYRTDWDEQGRIAAHLPAPDFSSPDFCALHLQPHARVLDAGAGLGHTALGFRERGFDVAVAERSHHRADRLESLGFRTFRTTIEGVGGAERFDLVHLRHVLEHVDDVHAVVAKCASLLAHGGLLYIAVPNWLGEHALQSFHFVPHLSLFSSRSLQALLARNGFETVAAAASRELRLLARLTGRTSEAAPVDSFGEAVARWACRALGNTGVQTLVWWESASTDVYYDWRRFDGAGRSLGAALALGVVARTQGRPAGLARRALPLPRSAWPLRALRYRAAGEALPVTIRYPGRPTVWIK